MKDEEEGRKTWPIYVQGATLEEAQGNLETTVDGFRKEYGLELGIEPVTKYEVLLFKGEEPGRSNLQGRGNSYKEALDGCVEDFGVDPAQFNQLVRIFAFYELTPKDQKAAQKIPPPSAGGLDTISTTRAEYIL